MKHIVEVRCPKCKQVSYYDRREVCPAQGKFARRLVSEDGKELDELVLPCKHAGCDQMITVRVDCEGYK